MNSRIREARKKANLTQKDLAEKLSLSRNFLVLVENGKQKPSERTIKDICRELNVRYEWLVFGDGPMRSEDDDLQAIVDSMVSGENQFIKDTIAAIASLDEEHQIMFEEVMKEIIKKMGGR